MLLWVNDDNFRRNKGITRFAIAVDGGKFENDRIIYMIALMHKRIRQGVPEFSFADIREIWNAVWLGQGIRGLRTSGNRLYVQSVPDSHKGPIPKRPGLGIKIKHDNETIRISDRGSDGFNADRWFCPAATLAAGYDAGNGSYRQYGYQERCKLHDADLRYTNLLNFGGKGCLKFWGVY